MKKFTEIVNTEWPNRAIRIKVGDVETYMGVNCRGLDEMRSEVKDWLDSHQILHCWYSRKEVELIYKGSEKYFRLVFGEV